MANQNAQSAAAPQPQGAIQATDANAPAQNILDDVCVIEGEKVNSTEMLARPPLGETREVALEEGRNYIFGFDKSEAASFVEENGTLTITFECGGKLVLRNYAAATGGDNAATFAFSDVIPQGELSGMIKVVDTTEEKNEDPENTAANEKTAKKTSAEDVANIEPAAGDEGAAARKLAQIEPAAGDAGGGTQNSGYGFNTPYTNDPVGPLNPVGPLGATSLNYSANFRQPNPLVGEEPTPVSISAADEFVDETDLGPIVRTGQIVINYGADGPGGIGPNGDFLSGGSQTGGALTSKGVPVVVTQTANGYEGVANGVTIFTLEIQSPSGEYTFTLFGPLDHADGTDPNDIINLTFGFVATDADGDSLSTSITVAVADDVPTITGDGVKFIDEGDLPGTASVSGNLVEDFGNDGDGEITPNGASNASGDLAGGVLSSGGVPVTITATANGYVGHAGGTEVFNLTIDPLTGEYTFNLLEALDHSVGGDTITLTFGAQIVDYDGDTDNTDIVISIKDDVPEIRDSNPTIGNGLEVIDETNMNGGSITVNGNLPHDTGSDTPATILPNGDTQTGGSLPGGNLTSHGVPVVITPTATGYVGTAGGTTVFTFTIGNNGAYSFTLNEQLDHADGSNPNDVINLRFGVRITDNDGDTDDGFVNVNIVDDAPVLTGDGMKTIYESALSPAAVSGNLVEDFGEDGQGNIHTTGSFSASGDLGGGLKSGGHAVTVTSTANGYVGTIQGGTVEVFTLTIHPVTGAYTFTLLKPLDHGAPGSHQILLTFGAEIVDYDGDTDTADIVIRVKDDVPEIRDSNPTIGNGLEVVDETNLGPIVRNGNIDFDFGGDGAGSFGASGTSSSSVPLFSHGVPVTVTPGPNGYVGTAGGNEIFTLTVNADGSYSFTLKGVLDHPNASDPNDVITLNFGVRVTDADGDSDTGNITVRVHDDGPVAVDDGVFQSNDGLVLTGNVLANDNPGRDGLGAVVSVTFNGVTTNIAPGATVNIAGTHGTLAISSNGQYTYTPNGGEDGTDQFRYTMKDYDGDRSSAKLTIQVDQDDHPVLVKPAKEVVDETNLGPIVETGVVQGNFFGDGPGTFSMNGSFSSTGSKLGGNLTSLGVPVLVTNTATGYVGKAGANEIFTITINPATGAYTFTLKGVLDHADALNPNDVITLNFGVRGTDNDGDYDETIIRVDVLDDAPKAYDDHNTQKIGVATGNVVTGLNGGPGAADDLSNDLNNNGSNTVTKIAFGATTVNVPAVGQATINGTYGQLKISSDGSYTYTPNGVTGGKDQFVYTLQDRDGDTSTAKLFLDTAPEVCVEIQVNNCGCGICIKEDSEGTVPVTASFTGGNGNETLTLTVTGIDTAWTITAPGWTNQGGGVYTLTLPVGQRDYSGQFTFKPPKDSDVDMNGVKFTASVSDPDTGVTKQDSTTLNVQVDAVVDVPVLNVSDVSQQNWYYKNQGYQVPLNISSKTTDTDGSEIITKIVIDLNQPLSNPVPPFNTLDDMGIGLNKGVEVSPGIWEITVNAGDATAALSGLKLVVPSNMDYSKIHNGTIKGNESVNIIVKSFVKEKVAPGDGNAECDFTDNETCVIKSICLTFRITPLVLDLNGNGIELVSIDAGVMFDMNNNGTLDKTGWVAGSDGLLALDINGDGVINNQSELFGNTDTLDNGFANLAQYDVNGDGKIDSLDAIYNDLLVWTDVNQDGISQSGELFGLADLGIKSINIRAVETDIETGDAYISHESTYTTVDGVEHKIADVSFNIVEGDNIGRGVTLEGTDGTDIIYGTDNNDVLIGGAGNDILFGGAGDDVFVFNALDGSVDTIKDFEIGDVLDVSGLLQGYDPVQDSINDFVFGTEANGNTVISVAVPGTEAPTVIAVLEGVTGLDINQIVQANHAAV